MTALWPADEGPMAAGLRVAADRLSPSAAALARMESSVMAQFEAATLAPVPAPMASPIARLRAVFVPRRAQRVAAFGLAASLALGSVAAAFAASGPGQPFYRLRLQVEALSLPAAGTAARLQADIDRAGSRLSELAAAGRSGDAGAADDAAGAYADALTGVLADDDSAAADALAALLSRHEQYLVEVAQSAAPSARTYVQRAVDAVRRAESDVQRKPGGGSAPSGANQAPAFLPAVAPAGQEDTHGPTTTTDGAPKPGQDAEKAKRRHANDAAARARQDDAKQAKQDADKARHGADKTKPDADHATRDSDKVREGAANARPEAHVDASGATSTAATVTSGHSDHGKPRSHHPKAEHSKPDKSPRSVPAKGRSHPSAPDHPSGGRFHGA